VAEAPVVVTTSGLTCEDVERVAVRRAPLELAADVRERIDAGRAVVERLVHGERLIYGLNTGLGHMRNERVSVDVLMDYQVQMIRGHEGGIGDPLPDEEVRAIVTARIAGAARGGSGLRTEAVDALIALLNADVTPVVAETGSVGASDLMHLADVALVLIGEGKARVNGDVLSGGEALRRAGLEPYRPQPKEGLALLSANGYSVGIGVLGVLEAERAGLLADAAGALTLEATVANPSPFDEEVARAKPFPGQIEAAAFVRSLLEGSFLYDPATELSVQDPLSLRTMPQVHGALREQAAWARRAAEIELNAMDDNPYVSIERDTMISNGNFHPMVLALAFDGLRSGLAHVGMVSERRMNKLMAKRFADPQKNPLAEDLRPRRPGPRRRGLVLYAAAALLAELKQLAAPATIHLPPLDLDVEDHGTLAPTAVLLTRRALRTLETILTAEVLMAVDVLDHEDPLPALGAGTRRLYETVRARVDSLPEEATSADVVAAARETFVELVPVL
jgi:histidine ammonia-lyase